jgi:hypothetical protein
MKPITFLLLSIVFFFISFYYSKYDKMKLAEFLNLFFLFLIYIFLFITIKCG